MTDPAIFTISLPQLAFGPGALDELGARATGLGMCHVALMTDPTLANGPWVAQAKASLEVKKIAVTMIADLAVEPTDASFLAAAERVRQSGVDGLVSVGGGSVIDTAKAANLYASAPADFLTYVNAPIGQAAEPDKSLMPHIACPTTCGTGSECTGIAVFDFVRLKTKTGIMSPKLLPNLALIDPRTMTTLPLSVLVATALDALSHALEAYTCRHFAKRGLAADPLQRPMTQGANPWSDTIAESAIRTIAENLRPAITEHRQGEGGEIAARGQLMWAAALAGNAFGNAGCHLPHAMSYPISAMVRDYRPSDWPPGPPLIPHGLSVLLTAPACYRLTAKGDPIRHAKVAQWLGAAGADPGEAIAGWVEAVMDEAGLPRRLRDIGYGEDDLPQLVEGALPQRRLLDNAPVDIGKEALTTLFQASL